MVEIMVTVNVPAKIKMTVTVMVMVMVMKKVKLKAKEKADVMVRVSCNKLVHNLRAYRHGRIFSAELPPPRHREVPHDLRKATAP